jgi:hypothetical protein
MNTFGSLLATIACIALLTGPAMAQSSPSGGMSGDMKGMAMPKKAPMHKTAMKMASTKRTCMDYAWQSQQEKDCEAGKIKPPKWH